MDRRRQGELVGNRVDEGWGAEANWTVWGSSSGHTSLEAGLGLCLGQRRDHPSPDARAAQVRAGSGRAQGTKPTPDGHPTRQRPWSGRAVSVAGSWSGALGAEAGPLLQGPPGLREGWTEADMAQAPGLLGVGGFLAKGLGKSPVVSGQAAGKSGGWPHRPHCPILKGIVGVQSSCSARCWVLMRGPFGAVRAHQPGCAGCTLWEEHPVPRLRGRVPSLHHPRPPHPCRTGPRALLTTCCSDGGGRRWW